MHGIVVWNSEEKVGQNIYYWKMDIIVALKVDVRVNASKIIKIIGQKRQIYIFIWEVIGLHEMIFLIFFFIMATLVNKIQ